MDAVEQVRSFNRLVTRRIGALEDTYLSTGRPLGANRTLWEIGAADTDLRALRARLGLDSGYLSRLVAALEREGLVERAPHGADRRVRAVRLTDAGREQRARLDRASDDLASFPSLDFATLARAADQAEYDRAFAQTRRSLAEWQRLVKADAPPDGKKSTASLLSFDQTLDAAGDSALFGTPDEIAAKLDALRSVGVDYVLLSSQGSRDSLRRFASGIMPAFAGA